MTHKISFYRTALLALLPATWLLSLANDAHAEPRWIRLSIVQDPSRSMTVSWHTSKDAPGQVQWGKSPEQLTEKAEAKAHRIGPELGVVHEAQLSGLEPQSQYYYRVGSDQDGWSAPIAFQTAPAPDARCSKVRFAYLADNRPDKVLGMGDNWSAILQEALGAHPQVILSGGDLVTEGTGERPWARFLEWTGAAPQSVPLMPVMGNHDEDESAVGDGAKYNQVFALPRSQGLGASGTEDYYYFEYGPVLVVGLSTQRFMDGAIPFGNQAAWLDSVLSEHPKPWKLVIVHEPIYTLATALSHSPNEKGQNAALVPVFDKHHVDLVLQSHNHWYERFEPSNCTAQGRPQSPYPCPVGPEQFDKGTVYVTSGGAGAFAIPVCSVGGYPGQAVCDGQHHYVLIDIRDGQLHLEAWASTRQQFGDNPSGHRLIDELWIEKPKGKQQCEKLPESMVESGQEQAAPRRRMPIEAWGIVAGFSAGAIGVLVRSFRRKKRDQSHSGRK